MRCASCGAAITPGGRFCSSCGSVVVRTTVTPDRGAAPDRAAAPDRGDTPDHGAATVPIPTVPPAAAQPPGHARRSPSGTWALLAVAVVAVLALVVGAAFAISRALLPDSPSASGSLPAASGSPQPSMTRPSAGATPTRSAVSPAPSTTPSSTPSAAASPSVTPPGSDLHPDVRDLSGSVTGGQVAIALQELVTGVNTGDFPRAYAVYGPRERATFSAATFAANKRGTRYSDLVIDAITPTPTGADAHVTFRTTQPAALGPDGQACSLWSLRYQMIKIGAEWQIDWAPGDKGYPRAC